MMADGLQLMPTGMRASDLDRTFFTKVARGIHPDAQLISFTEKPFDSNTGILTNLDVEDNNDKRLLGLRSYQLVYKVVEDEFVRDVVIKIRAIGYELWQGLNALVQQIGGTLGEVYKTRYDFSQICNAEKKDMLCVSTDNPVWKSLMPETYHIVNEPDRQAYAYAMEDLRSDAFTHLDSQENVACWTDADIKDALTGIARFHALYYGRLENMPDKLVQVLDAPENKQSHTFNADLWSLLTEHAHEAFPQLFDDVTTGILRNAITHIGIVCDFLDAFPQTLIHNDFNVRNVCLSKAATKGKMRLCLFDWELVRYGVPQHDLAEFITFVLPKESSAVAWQPYIDHYRKALKQELQKYGVSNEIMSSLDPEGFQTVFDMSVLELTWHRLASYMIAHRFANLPYIARVVGNCTRYLKSFQDKYDFLQNQTP